MLPYIAAPWIRHGKWIVTWIVTIEHGPVEMLDLPSYIAWWIFP